MAEAVAEGVGGEGGFAGVVFVFLDCDGAHTRFCQDGGGDAGAGFAGEGGEEGEVLDELLPGVVGGEVLAEGLKFDVSRFKWERRARTRPPARTPLALRLFSEAWGLDQSDHASRRVHQEPQEFCFLASRVLSLA